MPFSHHRTVRFRDTDAAGVVYFANVLSMCHEAYEASLAAAGIDLKAFFRRSPVAVPIVHASADYFRPMVCGDELEIRMIPRLEKTSEFSTHYELWLAGETGEPVQAARAVMRHVAIAPEQRQRVDLPEALVNWLERWGAE